MNPGGPAAGDIHYLALGDSYTIGEAVEPSQCWPRLLAHRLRERGLPMAAPRIIATTGWTTDELSEAMNQAALSPGWGMVSLLIGVNNQYRGRSVDDFRSEYRALLDRAIELASGRPERVFVLSIPDWALTPFGLESGRDVAAQSAQISAYNAAKRELTLGRGVSWFDITPSTREAPTEPQRVAADGLHPSALMYALWVEQIIDDVAALLETTP